MLKQPRERGQMRFHMLQNVQTSLDYLRYRKVNPFIFHLICIRLLTCFYYLAVALCPFDQLNHLQQLVYYHVSYLFIIGGFLIFFFSLPPITSPSFAYWRNNVKFRLICGFFYSPFILLICILVGTVCNFDSGNFYPYYSSLICIFFEL